MWYEVPQTKPTPAEKPKPIFPWEQQPDRPRATRVFAEDLVPEPTPAPAPAAPTPTHAFSTVHFEDNGGPRQDEVAATGLSSPERPTSPKSADEQWQEFQQNSVNAWDNVPSIESYVRAIMEAQARRNKSQTFAITGPSEEVLSPSIGRRERRESLIITDFPSAVDRPSLPVTPAPIRRPTFWGEERDEAGELPAADGVPDQADWVCPQCGFSSVSASDFQRPRRELSTASSTTAIVVPSLDTIIVTAAEIVPAPETSSKTSPPKIAQIERTTGAPALNAALYRAGISLRGAPLASLTNPSLVSPPLHITDIAVSSAVLENSRAS